MNDNAKRAGNKPAKPSPDMFTESAVQPRPPIVADAPTAPEPVAVDDIEIAAQPAVDVPVTIETTNEFRAPPAARGAIVAHDGSSVLAAPDTSPRIVNGGVVCVLSHSSRKDRGVKLPGFYLPLNLPLPVLSMVTKRKGRNALTLCNHSATL